MGCSTWNNGSTSGRNQRRVRKVHSNGLYPAATRQANARWKANLASSERESSPGLRWRVRRGLAVRERKPARNRGKPGKNTKSTSSSRRRWPVSQATAWPVASEASQQPGEGPAKHNSASNSRRRLPVANRQLGQSRASRAKPGQTQAARAQKVASSQARAWPVASKASQQRAKPGQTPAARAVAGKAG